MPEAEPTTYLKVPVARHHNKRRKKRKQQMVSEEGSGDTSEESAEENFEVQGTKTTITVTNVDASDDESQGSRPSKSWRGKIACFAAFCTQLIVLGQYHCSGIIYSALLQEYKEGRANTALILSLAGSSTYAFGPLTAYVTERYGPWPVGLTGGIFCSLGLLLSSFCPVVPLLFLTYGLCWGIGSCMAHRASLAIMCKYFGKYLLVTNLTWIGCALATFAFSPMLQDLFSNYSVAITFRFLAGVESLLILFAFLFIPFTRENTYKEHAQRRHRAADNVEEEDRVFSFDVFANRKFLLWVIAVCFMMLITLVPLVHMIQVAKDLAIDPVNTAMLVSYLAIGSSTGRLFFGRLLTSVHGHQRVRVVQSGLFFVGIFTLILPFVMQDFCLALYVLVFGFFEGCFATLMPAITIDVVGAELVPSALSWLCTIAAFPEAVGPLIAGWVHDRTGSYQLGFYFFGGTLFLAVVLMTLMQFVAAPPREREVSFTNFSGEVSVPLECVTTNDHLRVPTAEALNENDITIAQNQTTGV